MRLKEIELRLSAIKAEIEKRGAEMTAEEITNLENEVKALNEERASLLAEAEAAEKRNALLDKIAGGAEGGRVVRSFAPAAAESEEERFNKSYRSAFLKHLQGKTLTETEARDFSSAADSAGAVIPVETEEMIVKKLKEIAPLMDEITLLRVKGAVKFAVEGTIADASIHTENALISGASDNLVTITLNGYEIVKLVRISATVRTMAVNAFETWLVEMLSEKIAEAIENCIINGDGTNEPAGIESLTFVADTNAVDYASTKPTTSEIYKLIGLLASRHARRAKFVMHRSTLWNDIMPLRDDAKAPICREDGNGGYVIAGYPVRLSDYATIGNVYFGNLKAIVGNLAQGIEVNASAESAFAYNAIDYRGTAIFDCKVSDGAAFVKGAASIS